MSFQTKLENLQNFPARKLAAMVPSWAKPTPMPRSTIKPHTEPEFPAWTYRITCQAIVKCKIPSDFELTDDLARYVAAFDELNNLRPVDIEIVRCEAFA